MCEQFGLLNMSMSVMVIMCTEQIEERMVLVRAIYLLCSYVEAQQICDKTTSDGCCHDDGP